METIKITILGDVCPTADYQHLFDDEDKLLGESIREILQASDLNIVNFECPATDSETKIQKCGPNLKAAPRDIDWMKRMGFDVLSLANNHIKDFGNDAVMETIKRCQDAGLKTVGAGSNAAGARRGLVVEVGSKHVGILSFAEEEFNLASDSEAGANHFDPYESPEDITALKADCDYLIVLYHGGSEHYSYPSPLLQKKCRNMARSGADLVICQHSHCIGTLEAYQGSTILYGQGNGVFGYRDGNDAWNEGLLLELTLGASPDIQYTVLKATPTGVITAEEADAKQRLDQMHEESKRLDDAEWLQSSFEEFSLARAELYRPQLFAKGRVFNKLNRLTHNLLCRTVISRYKSMVALNLLRCEAHHEVMVRALERDYYGK